MKIYAGVDIGSLACKAVLIDEQGVMKGSSIVLTGAMPQRAGKAALRGALDEAGLQESDITYLVSTGYGRHRLERANEEVTEITCHATAAHDVNPEVKILIDIGGQDSKLIRLDEGGQVGKFLMNDKCAAGTGRFLEVMARALEVDLDQMGPLSLEAHKELKISSMCTVFAESEVISLVAQEHDVRDILWGLHLSVARRVGAMARGIGVRPPVMMSGGVAKNVGMLRALEQTLGTPLLVPPEPQLMGALGAASIARERCQTAACSTAPCPL